MTDCLFCHLQHQDAVVIAANRHAYAVLDIAPIRPGHALVIPRAHVEDFFELDAAVQADMLQLANALARAIREECSPQRVGLLVAGFDVPHAHLHVVPIHDTQDLTSRVVLEGNKQVLPEAALASLRKQLKARLPDAVAPSS